MSHNREDGKYRLESMYGVGIPLFDGLLDISTDDVDFWEACADEAFWLEGIFGGHMVVTEDTASFPETIGARHINPPVNFGRRFGDLLHDSQWSIYQWDVGSDTLLLCSASWTLKVTVQS